MRCLEDRSETTTSIEGKGWSHLDLLAILWNNDLCDLVFGVEDEVVVVVINDNFGYRNSFALSGSGRASNETTTTTTLHPISTSQSLFYQQISFSGQRRMIVLFYLVPVLAVCVIILTITRGAVRFVVSLDAVEGNFFGILPSHFLSLLNEFVGHSILTDLSSSQ